MQEKLMGWIRWVFLASILLVAGFLSCLTAMRYAIRGSEVAVPNLAGKTLPEAAQVLGASTLQLKVDSHRYHGSVTKDRIVAQIPGEGFRLKRHSNVRVVVSLGAKRIPIPDLKGETLRAGQILLLRRGLALGMISTISSSDDQESGRIMAQDPEPESQFAQSPQINLLLSSGKRRREYLMPDLMGKSSHEVVAQFAGLGLNLGSVHYQSIPGVEKDTILRQFPLSGSKVAEGSAIDIEVCQ
jgi:eukaryotic-like serine/threonine-protein kinase